MHRMTLTTLSSALLALTTLALVVSSLPSVESSSYVSATAAAFANQRPKAFAPSSSQRPLSPRWSLSSSSSSSSSSSETANDSSAPKSNTREDDNGGDPLGLTPELRKMTNAFASIPDEKTRYKQLLYMANQLEPLEAGAAVPENKVPGCLSTVYVHAVEVPAKSVDEQKGGVVIKFTGDSDGLLTKGLVALLVRGLSGCTTDEIQRVDPQFIHEAKISQSLTPGRNNGFLNMLAVMKKKAAEVAERSSSSSSSSSLSSVAVEEERVGDKDDNDNVDTTNVPLFEERKGKPIYNAMMSTLLRTLKPKSIHILDKSDQHAGHAGAKGWEESGESHFALDIVANAFEGLSLVKRHQLIYMLLGDVMPKIHALQINARTPDEVDSE